MTNKKKKVLHAGIYLAVGAGALLLSTPEASAISCGWQFTTGDNLTCGCGSASGTVQDFTWGNGTHMFIVNLTAGGVGAFIDGIAWPGPNNGTHLRDFGANDGSQTAMQPINYEFVACSADDGRVTIQ